MARAPETSIPMPRISLILLGLFLLGLVVAPTVGLEPWVVAAAGAVVLAIRAIVLKQVKPIAILAETNPLFLVFVAALGVVVDAATNHGLQDDLATLLPAGTSLLALLALAVIAAVLANLINNLPAILVLLAALGSSPAAGAVLAIPDRRQRGTEPDLQRIARDPVVATCVARQGPSTLARPIHRARPAHRARVTAARHCRAMGGSHVVLTGRAGPAPPSRWSG
jgi:hypothetical protein